MAIGWWSTRRDRDQKKTAEERNRDYYQRNKHKVVAQRAVNAAVRESRLPKVNTLECKCQGPNCYKYARYYHHWSYKPQHWLSVIPVCTLCHADIHNKKVTLSRPSKYAIKAKKVTQK